MSLQPRTQQFLKSFFLISAAGLLILFHENIGTVFFQDYKLGVGSTLPNKERTRFMFFYGYWVTFGTGAIFLMASGLSLLGGITDLWRRVATGWEEASEEYWVVGATLVTLLGGILIQQLVLDGAPLTDDEWSYRFSARTLASGHLTANSLPEPLKLFFDRNQMINDGRWFSQYFIGWPMLAVPGVWLGIAQYMNAIYAAATIPPLFFVTRRLISPNAAKLSTILYLTSPFLMVEAATFGSHTSCLMALTWALFFYLRSTEPESHWSWHGLFSFTFCIAFFVRPYSTLALALPLLLGWSWHLLRQTDEQRLTKIAAFTLPAIAMASFFLLVNTVQNGGPFQTGYASYIEYINANDFRFTNFSVTTQPSQWANLRFDDLTHQIAMLGVGFFRLNSSLFGWPASLLLVLFAPLTRRTGLVWASFCSFLLFQFPLNDPGADAYGPVHFFELSLPILVLSVAGLARLMNLGQLLDRHIDSTGAPSHRFQYWPALAVGSAIVLSFQAYHSVRLGTVAKMADNISLPHRIVRSVDLKNALVFSPQPFAPPCLIEPARHSVGYRPTNHPSLTDSVLWVNHVSVTDDKRLLEFFPDRNGYVLLWHRKKCQPELIPLDHVPAGALPIQGEKYSIDRSDWESAPTPETFSPYENRF